LAEIWLRKEGGVLSAKQFLGREEKGKGGNEEVGIKL
jgi:hypothetical protein